MIKMTKCSLSLFQGMRIDSEPSNEQESPPTNEADLKDNKESKLKQEEEKETGEGSEGKKAKEEQKEATGTPGDEPGDGVSSKYRLRGVVVHSGQASGGHYYSFISFRSVLYSL